METKRTTLRRWDVVVVVAGALVAGLCLTVVHAEDDRRSPGAMSVTFLENGDNRTSSKYFYVSREQGLIRWRNYKEKHSTAANRSVYELEAEESIARAPGTHHVPSEVARAQQPTPNTTER